MKLAVAAAVVAAGCSVWWGFLSRHHLLPTLSSAEISAAALGEAAVSDPAAASRVLGQNWFTALFAPPSATAGPRQRALSQLEAAGLALTGEDFVRTAGTRNRALVDLFLQAGIDVNAPGADGRTALLAATLAKDWPLAESLLGSGADVNEADAHGFSPLMAAAAAGQSQPVQTLLKWGASPAATDEQGHTALHWALATRNVGVSLALLGAGVPSTGKCCDGGRDLLAHAFDTGNWQLIEPILKEQPATLTWNSNTRAALVQAITARDSARAGLLLSKHPAQPTPESKAQPLLAYALLANDLAQFEFLLACGADPNTPLNSPVEKAFNQAVQSNLMRGYLESEPGMTTLMLAAGLGREDFTRALLDKGARRGLVTGKYKMAALSFAAFVEDAEVMQMLIGDSPSPEKLRVQISLGAQRASLIRDGVSIYSTDISSGRTGFSTPTGEFVVTDKHAAHMSTIYKASMPFFMRLNCRDFGMHQGQLPGYPASHGCIRLPSGAATRLFKEVPVGTLVSITH